MPISGKEMRKLFYEIGYEPVPGGGKGSHWKLKKKGYPTVIIPSFPVKIVPRFIATI